MKIVKKVLLGIMSGFTIMVVTMLIILLVTKDNYSEYITKEAIIRNIWCSALVGIAFYLPAMIYENKKMPKGFQVLFHMGLGYLVFFPISIYAKWIPISKGVTAIIGFVLFTVVISFSIWFGFYLYYKKEAKMITQKLRERI